MVLFTCVTGIPPDESRIFPALRERSSRRRTAGEAARVLRNDGESHRPLAETQKGQGAATMEVPEGELKAGVRFLAA